MATTRVHVVPSGTEWLVEEQAETLMVSRSREVAERCAAHEAKRIDGEVVVHNEAGHIDRIIRPRSVA